MQPKTGVTFRFKSWVLIPTEDHWSGWTHCDRNTMLAFLKQLQRIDEYSTAHMSPNYDKQYRAVEEVQVITWTGTVGDEWTWRPDRGWYRTPIDASIADVPTGKGKRPPRKSRAQLEAERKAADDEIFGIANEPEPKIEDPLATDVDDSFAELE